MKKSLSLFIAIAMVFSMFGAMAASAATDAEKAAAEALKGYEIIKGNLQGDLLIDDPWLRQDVTILLARLHNAEVEAKATAKGHTFADVRASYDGFVTWAKEKGFFQGHSATKFGFGDNITLQEFYAVVLRVIGVDTAGENYAKVPELAVKAGLVAEGTDLSAQATRGQTYVALVKALDTVVAGTGKTLGNILGLPGFEVQAGVKVTDANKLTVTFAKAVDTAKATFTIKRGTAGVNVKSVKFNDAKTEAVVETHVGFQAGDHTLVIGGVDGLVGADATFAFTTEAERLDNIQIDSNGYRADALKGGVNATTPVLVGVKFLNQYGQQLVNKTLTGTAHITSTVTGATLNSAKDEITVPGVLEVLNSINVSVVSVNGGISKSAAQAVTINPVKTVSSITLSAPEVPNGKTAIEQGLNGIVLPYVAKDQYGNDVKLKQSDILAFYSSDNNVVNVTDKTASGAADKTFDNISVNNDGKIVFNTVAKSSGAKNVTLTVVTKGGATSNITFEVVGSKTLSNVTLVSPTVQFGLGDKLDVEIQAVDQYGNAMTASEIKSKEVELVIASGNSTVFTVVNKTTGTGTDAKTHADVKVNKDKAYVTVQSSPTGTKGTALLIASLNANGFSTNVALTVVDAKEPQSISAKADIVKAVGGAEVTVKADFADQYGDNFSSDKQLVEVKVGSAAFTTAKTIVSVDELKEGIKFVAATGTDVDQTADVKFILHKEAPRTDANKVDETGVTLTVVSNKASLEFQVEDLGTIASVATDFQKDYGKKVVVVGKIGNDKVALNNDIIKDVTSQNTDLATVEKKDGNYVVTAKADKEGDAGINVHINQSGLSVVTSKFKVSKAAPTVVSVAIKSGDNNVTKGDVAAGLTQKSALLPRDKQDNVWVEVKDQYGVVNSELIQKLVTIYATDKSGAPLAITTDAPYTFVAGEQYKLTAIALDKQVSADVTAK